MYSEVKIEGLVIRGIKELREKRRKGVNKKDLFYYVEEIDENLMPDIFMIQSITWLRKG